MSDSRESAAWRLSVENSKCLCGIDAAPRHDATTA
jgi:hypothetical protein